MKFLQRKISNLFDRPHSPISAYISRETHDPFTQGWEQDMRCPGFHDRAHTPDSDLSFKSDQV